MCLRGSRWFTLLALLVLTLGAAGCTRSENPLGSRQEGFVDLYLLGRWHAYDADGGRFEVGALLYDVALDDGGDIAVRAYNDEGRVDRVYSAYTTRIAARKYLNTRFVDCPDCEQQDRERQFAAECPYQIVQYSTFPPSTLAVVETDAETRELLDTLIVQSAKLRGQLLFIATMDTSYIRESMSEGTIAGDPGCDGCDGEDACISSGADVLQTYLSDYDREVYPVATWEVVIRANTH